VSVSFFLPQEEHRFEDANHRSAMTRLVPYRALRNDDFVSMRKTLWLGKHSGCGHLFLLYRAEQVFMRHAQGHA
jgi:hypothetical protein